MITTDRARQILASYGGTPEQWPEGERTDLQHLLSFDKKLQALQQQALQLDNQLTDLLVADEAVSNERLEAKILASLPARRVVNDDKRSSGWFDDFSERLRSFIGDNYSSWTIAGSVLTLVLAAGLIMIGNNHTGPALSVVAEGDAWSLMAEDIDTSSELELFAMLEPELFEDDSDIL